MPARAATAVFLCKITTAFALFVCAVAGDGVLLSMVFNGELGVSTAFPAHVGLALVAASSTKIALRTRSGLSVSVLVGIGLLIAGPPGLILAAASLVRVVDAAEQSPFIATLLAERRHEIKRSAAQELADAIAAGRTIRPQKAQPIGFHDAIANGSLREVQAVLGLIGLEYYPEYRKVLAAALKSERAALRVQAAAVHAKLRETISTRFQSCIADCERALSREADYGGLLPIIESLTYCLQSGFLDGAQCRRLSQLICRIDDALTQSIPPVPPDIERALIRALSAAGEHSRAVKWLVARPVLDDREMRELRLSSLIRLRRHGDLNALLTQEPHVDRPAATIPSVPMFAPRLEVAP
jgi:hypothetical protein